tara:strand:+ start:871 stop:1086 length:216 start_codon:yes stop_codon:yes gene_type:complete
MSIVKNININNKNISPLKNPEVNEKKTTGRVDINHLIARVRKKENAENRSSLIFFSIFGAVILFLGILLSF